ncbi:MAG: hypothetical protein JWR44_2646 [Hymenobacter sp.]|jgi:hypothetical protein|nr:hypothetical protein [Hymenobacter sp.]
MMYVAYFSEYTLPRQGAASRVLRRAGAPTQPRRSLAHAQDRNYLLDQQQTIYDELVANRTLALESKAALPNLVSLSAAEITRDLAGWTSPLAGTGQKQ